MTYKEDSHYINFLLLDFTFLQVFGLFSLFSLTSSSSILLVQSLCSSSLLSRLLLVHLSIHPSFSSLPLEFIILHFLHFFFTLLRCSPFPRFIVLFLSVFLLLFRFPSSLPSLKMSYSLLLTFSFFLFHTIVFFSLPISILLLSSTILSLSLYSSPLAQFPNSLSLTHSHSFSLLTCPTRSLRQRLLLNIPLLPSHSPIITLSTLCSSSCLAFLSLSPSLPQTSPYLSPSGIIRHTRENIQGSEYAPACRCWDARA